MCGIAGFVGLGDRADLERMTEAMFHRGPDGSGTFVDEADAVFLGHRRLAIVDLAGGHQPMWNEDSTVGIVFNGEIYNHAELRAELVKAGHRFATSHSDTEVLVHGYEEWREQLPAKLNGMFAFAILDRKRRQIFLARDRFGEKPLYYSQRNGVFAFASELPALAAHKHVSRSIDQNALAKLLAWGYLPAPNSILQDSRKLPGGHWLSYDFKTGTARTQCYWAFRLAPDTSLSDADTPRLVDELEALLGQAARRRLMSDVPLGVMLSGGLDSSCILAVLAKARKPESLDTFTIGFTEASFDEREPARLVANHIGTRHHEKVLDLDKAKDLIPGILASIGEPFADASILPTAWLSSFTRERVTVALSGDGGDELLAGYDPFLALKPASLYDALVPGPVHRGMRRMAGMLPTSERNMSFDFKLKRVLMGLSSPSAAWLPTWMAPLEPEQVSAITGRRYTAEELYSEAIGLWTRDASQSLPDRALEFFTTFYLQDDILMKSDQATMLASLEGRAVFLDNDLVDFCRRLPIQFKLRGRTRKFLLRKLAERLLPSEIVNRKKKGFGIPLAAWLKHIPATPPMQSLGGLDLSWAGKAWNEHRAGHTDHRLFLWLWLSMQAFNRRLSA